MSSDSIEKSDIVHQESITISMPSGETKVNPYAPLPTTDLIEFQKTMIGAAVGFGGFSLSSFVMGLLNTGIVTNVPEVAVAVSLSYGGFALIMAGIIGVIDKNPFSASAFITFGSFYVTYALMFIPGVGFLSAAIAADQIDQCLGLVSLGYCIASFVFLMGTLRQPILVRLILLFTFLSLITSAISSFTGIVVLTKVSGWFSVSIAVIAWYSLTCLIYNEHNTPIRLPFF